MFLFLMVKGNITDGHFSELLDPWKSSTNILSPIDRRGITVLSHMPSFKGYLKEWKPMKFHS